MIEDKRKFDIMEFVSFKGTVSPSAWSLLMENRREEGTAEGPFLSPAPPHLDPRCCVWWKPRLHISSRAMRS